MDTSLRVEPDRPVFVLGCPRSGTTLLQVMLTSHPRLAVPPENRFVLESCQERRRFGDLRRRESREALGRWIVERRESKFRDLRLDADEVLAEIVAGPPTLGSALGIVLRAYARRSGKSRWGDKRPAYFWNVALLRRLFPDAQFVHVVRDGRDAVASLKRMPWYPHSSLTAMSLWAAAIDYGQRWRRALPVDTWHEVVYERLVQDPEPELRRLCAFLGEGFDPAMARPQETARTAVPKRKKHHARLRNEVAPDHVGTWRDGLEPDEVRLMEHVSARRLRAYGFPLSGDAGRPPPALVLQYRAVDARQRLGHHRRWLEERARELRDPTPLAAQLTSGQISAATSRPG